VVKFDPCGIKTAHCGQDRSPILPALDLTADPRSHANPIDRAHNLPIAPEKGRSILLVAICKPGNTAGCAGEPQTFR